MKYILIVIFFVLSHSLKGQDSRLILKQQAREMADAASSGDYSLVLRYTYPKILKDFTRDEALQAITEAMENVRSQGIKIESVEIGEPGPMYTAGKELHCLIPEKIILTSRQGRFLKNSNLLAVSMDNGQNWYFVDCNMGKDNMLLIFPNFNKELIIPQESELFKL